MEKIAALLTLIPVFLSACPNEYELRAFLLQNHNTYASSVRPLKNASAPIDVNISFGLTRLNDIVEKDQLLYVTGFLVAEWKNEYFVWKDNAEFHCMESIVFSTEDVWLPDLSLTNMGDIYDLIAANGHKVVVSSDGTSHYRPAKRIEVFCDLDLTYFPFDKQTCKLHFESWLYTTDYQRFTIVEPAVSLVRWTENDQWILQKSFGRKEQITYENEDELFDRVVITLVLKRRVVYYGINIIGPSVIISFVELVIFMLPTIEIEKVPLSFTCLLAYTVFQLMINDDMPRTSEHTPMLSYYIILQMAYLSIAILGQGVVFLFLWNMEQKKPIPEKAYNIAKKVGHYLLVRENKDSEPYDDKQNVEEDKSGGLGSYIRRLTTIYEDEEKLNSRHRRNSTLTTSPSTLTASPVVEDVLADAIRLSTIPEGESDAVVSQYSTPQNDVDGETPRKLSFCNDHAKLTSAMLEKLKSVTENAKLKKRWLLMADVVDRSILIVYTSAIIITPVLVFVVLPVFG